MTVDRDNVGKISCAVLFILIFISQKSAMAELPDPAQGAELGLLLFILPGLLGGVLASEHKIRLPLLAATLASPLCLMLFYVGNAQSYTLWHQLTYLLSAVFWCGSGALICAFAEVLLRHPAHR